MRSRKLTTIVGLFVAVACLAAATPLVAPAYDYNSPIWAYTKYVSPRGGNIQAHTNTRMYYGEGWNLLSYDYTNGVHWVWADPGSSCSNIGNLKMTGDWKYDMLGGSVSFGAGTGGAEVGVTFSVTGNTISFTGTPTRYCNLVEHYFGGPRVNSGSVCVWRSENVNGTAVLYGAYVSVNASDNDPL